MDSETLTARMRRAAAFMREHGWTQNQEIDDQSGAVCLTGAIRRCAPENGDEFAIQTVLRDLETDERWNDQSDQTMEKVVAYLESFDLHDELLAQTFGPNWRAVLFHIRQAASVPPEAVAKICEAWIYGPKRAAYEVRERIAVRGTMDHQLWYRAGVPACDAVHGWDGGRPSDYWHASRAAEWAGSAIGLRHKMTAEEFETVYSFWAAGGLARPSFDVA